MASIPKLAASAPAAEVAAELDRAGCVVVTGVTDEATRAALARDLAPYVEAADSKLQIGAKYPTENGMVDFYPTDTKRVTALAAKSETYRSFVVHPLMLSMCDALLTPNCATYQVHATAAVIVGPGATEQVLHREEDPFQFVFKLPRPNLVIASMWAISEFTEANGGTHLVPGSHRWPLERKPRQEEIAAAEMPAGSVLMWMGGTLHGAGANRSRDWRYGVFLSYSLGWLRQEENQYLDTPPELARTMPRQVSDLLGYKMHTALGYTDIQPKSS